MTPEFSRPTEAESLPDGGRVLSVEAAPEEREALRNRFGLLGLDALRAEIVLLPEAGGKMLRVEGTLHAQVVQECGVTLEPFSTTVSEAFAETFLLEPSQDGTAGEEPLEVVAGGVIDVGELTAEHLSLALDPFPRSEGAAFVAPAGVEANGPDRENPFIALKASRQSLG